MHRDRLGAVSEKNRPQLGETKEDLLVLQAAIYDCKSSHRFL